MKSAKPVSVEAYIESFPKERQKLLAQLRATIRKAAPKADEMISYSMPLYKLNGIMLVSFACWKDHIGLYPSPVVVPLEFKKELAVFAGSKATLKFPLDKALPLSLISRCVKYRMNEISSRAKTGKQ